MALEKNISPIRALATAAVSLIVVEVFLYFTHNAHYQRDALTGWAVATLFHIAGLAAFKKGIGRDMNKFMLFALGGIIIRLFLLIILVLIVIVTPFLMVGAFLIGLLPTYFIGSWTEIAFLARSGQGIRDNGSRGRTHNSDG